MSEGSITTFLSIILTALVAVGVACWWCAIKDMAGDK
jgi:hypothetical protein